MYEPEEQRENDPIAASSYRASRILRLRPEDVRQAVLDLWQKEYERTVRLLTLYSKNSRDAEDAVAAAFVEAWALTSVPGAWERIRKPRAWLQKVAFIKYGELRKQRSGEVELTTELTEVISRRSAVDPSALTMETGLVRTILLRLDPETRLVMAYHIVEGYRSIEIARLLGEDPQKIRDLTKKGRSKLIAELSAMGLISGGRDREPAA